MLYQVIRVSRSAYYDWLVRPVPLITDDELQIDRRLKPLFQAIPGSLGSRGIVKNLRKEAVTSAF